MSFLEKIKTSRSDLLYLVRGKDRGEQCWHYVLVDKPKHELFKIRVKSDFIELMDYGTVLESGWGQDPPEDVAARIKAEYS